MASLEFIHSAERDLPTMPAKRVAGVLGVVLSQPTPLPHRDHWGTLHMNALRHQRQNPALRPLITGLATRLGL